MEINSFNQIISPKEQVNLTIDKNLIKAVRLLRKNMYNFNLSSMFEKFLFLSLEKTCKDEKININILFSDNAEEYLKAEFNKRSAKEQEKNKTKRELKLNNMKEKIINDFTKRNEVKKE